jgi:hypothetical protein
MDCEFRNEEKKHEVLERNGCFFGSNLAWVGSFGSNYAAYNLYHGPFNGDGVLG